MLVTFFFPITRSLVPVCVTDSYVAFARLSVLQNVFNDSRPGADCVKGV